MVFRPWAQETLRITLLHSITDPLGPCPRSAQYRRAKIIRSPYSPSGPVLSTPWKLEWLWIEPPTRALVACDCCTLRHDMTLLRNASPPGHFSCSCLTCSCLQARYPVPKHRPSPVRLLQPLLKSPLNDMRLREESLFTVATPTCCWAHKLLRMISFPDRFQEAAGGLPRRP
jgi:hypothetical protein